MGKYLDIIKAHEAQLPKPAPPLDANGAPCGGCPGCGQGEFWRWPKFHSEHNPADWRCCFCDPIPHGSGPCDFCGVPDSMVKAAKVMSSAIQKPVKAGAAASDEGANQQH